MLESLSTDKLDYEKLSLEEQQKRGILGRLTGVIADFVNPTRNQRRYSEKLWENVFADPIMKEKIENRCCFGELGHPADRTEVDMEKIALCLAEIPKKGKDGCLHGVFDILDTPNGRILKCLCDYGCNIGVSSRGEGDLITGFNGDDEVDPDTYSCECWDAVILPSVKSARMKYVTESLDTKVSLQESLNKIIESSSEDDKKVIKESLELLDLNNYSQEEVPVNNIEDENDIAVDNNEAVEENVVSQLQESLQTQQKLLDTISMLQEKLSVSYAKETKYQEDIDKYSKAISSLKDNLKRANLNDNKIKQLNESLKLANQKLEAQNSTIDNLKSKLKISSSNNKTLNESYQKQNQNMVNQVEKLNLMNTKLQESLNEQIKKSQELEESFQSKQKDFQIKQKELDGKVNKYKSLAEKYQKIAEKAVGKYIDSKAISLGISNNEIRNKLPQTYSFTDIDRICEELRQYKLNINNLPFNSYGITKQLTESSKLAARSQSENSILPKNKGYEDVDDIDEQLLSLAGIN